MTGLTGLTGLVAGSEGRFGRHQGEAVFDSVVIGRGDGALDD